MRRKMNYELNKRHKANDKNITEIQNNSLQNTNQPQILDNETSNVFDQFTYSFVNNHTAFARNLVSEIVSNNSEIEDVRITNINENSIANNLVNVNDGIRINAVRNNINRRNLNETQINNRSLQNNNLNNNDIRVIREEFVHINNTNSNEPRIIRENNNFENQTLRNSQFQLSFYPLLNQEYFYDITFDREINFNNQNLNDSIEAFLSYFQNFVHGNKKVFVSKEDLKKIKIFKYKEKPEKEECSICLENFVKNEKVRLLKCEHFFHCKCVDKWLLNESNQCPICRKKVTEKETVTL